MKRLNIFILLMHAIVLQGLACDFCTQFIEGEPMTNENLIRFSFRTASYSGKHAQTGFQKHASEDVNWRETFVTLDLGLQYYFTPKLRIQVGLPVGLNTIVEEGKTINQVSGVGDLNVAMDYQVFHSAANKNFQHRWLLGLGVFAPTGEFQATGMKQFVDPLLQPGMGAWGAQLRLNAMFQWSKFNGLWNVNGSVWQPNPDGYAWAPRLNSTIVLGRGFSKNQWEVQPALGAYAEFAPADQWYDSSRPNTGGLAGFFQAQVQLAFRSIGMHLGWQIPVHQKLNGDQGVNLPRYHLGLKYRIK